MRSSCLLFVLPSVRGAWSPLRDPLRPQFGASQTCRAIVTERYAEKIHSDVNHDEVDNSNDRRRFVSLATMAALTAIQSSPVHAINSKSRTQGYDVQKTSAEWSSVLSPTQYDILRNGATERPYSSILEGEERVGTYVCAGCGTPLFESKVKFHSGTGWPSFARALSGVEIEQVNAVQANLSGAELRCGTCGGHLGDVFADGFLFVGTPAFVSGKRFCIDGAALVFEPSKNGEAVVRGDQSPPKEERSEPDWLSPPKITPRSE